MHWAGWNTQGLSRKTLQHIEFDLGLQLCMLVETKGEEQDLARKMEKELGANRLLAGGPLPADKSDDGAGVAIWLSAGMAGKVANTGVKDQRMMWVQFDIANAPPVVAVAAYCPCVRPGRAYTQEMFWKNFVEMIQEFPPNTRFICFLDANAQLCRHLPGITERWCLWNYPMDNRGKLFAQSLRTLGWVAVSSNEKIAVPPLDLEHSVATYCDEGKTNSRGKTTHRQLDWWICSPGMVGKIKKINPSWQATHLRHSKHTDHAMLKMKIEFRIQRWKKPEVPQYARMYAEGGETVDRYAAESDRLIKKARKDRPAIEDFYEMSEAEQGFFCEIAENPAAHSAQAVAAQKLMSEGIQDEIDEQYQLLVAVPPQAYKIANANNPQQKNNKRARRGHLSDDTVRLLHKKAKLLQKDPKYRKTHPLEYKAMQKEIARACMSDFNKFVDKILIGMDAAEKAGDHKELRRLLELVGKKAKKAGGYAKPTTDADGNKMFDVEKEAEQWAVHLQQVFDEDALEKDRTPWATLPAGARAPLQNFDRAKLVKIVHWLKKGKAGGKDQTVIETFLAAPALLEELFEMTETIYRTEQTPKTYNDILQFMLYKGGGKDKEDRSSFRPLSMIQVARKLMALYLLVQLQSEIPDTFFPETTQGFREIRGCDDVIGILDMIMDRMIDFKQDITIVFIDLAGAFDTCSWRALDVALEAAKASVKSRAMFRALYRDARGIARASKPNGRTADSEPYPIKKSVLQG